MTFDERLKTCTFVLKKRRSLEDTTATEFNSAKDCLVEPG